MKRFFKRALKIMLWCIGSLLMLLVLLVLLIRLPAVQNYITHQAVSFVSGKTHTRLQLKRLYVGFPKTLIIEGLYAEDAQHDTLLAVQKLEVNINMLALLHKKAEVSSLLLSGATANINRNADSVYNFAFLINAFSNGAQKPVVKHTAKSDTTRWQIQVDKIALENIRGGFSDSVGGTTVAGFIGRLDLNMKAIDIRHLSFNGNELSLSNTYVRMVQTKQGSESPDTSITLMPLLSLNKLKLKKVSFAFENKVNSQLYDIRAGNALLMPGKIDLNAHVIQVKRLDMDSTSATITMNRNPPDTTKQQVALPGRPKAAWKVAADELKLAAINFNFDISNIAKQDSGIDYNHLGVRNANINISNASYTGDKVTGDIHNISLKEQSGFVLKKLNAQVLYDDKHATFQHLTLVTNHSKVGNFISVSYPSVSSISKDVGELGVNADFDNTSVGVEDILLFAQQLKTQPVFTANRGRTVVFTGKLTGKLKDLTATALTAGIDTTTAIALDAHIIGLPDALNADYDINLKSLRTTASDLKKLTGGALPASINLPQNIALNGTVKGSIKNAAAKLSLQTSAGDAELNAHLKMTADDTAYEATLQTHNLNIGYILKQDTLLGPVTLTANLNGHSIAPANLQAKLDADIQSARFNKYNYKNITLKATADHNHYTANLAANDSALMMDIQATASLVKDSEFVKATGHLSGANLQKLKLVKDDIRTSGYLAVDMTGNPANLNGTVRLDNMVVMKDKNSYRIDSLVVASVNDTGHATLSIKSPVVTADYDGSIKLQNLPGILTQHINHYFRVTNDTAVASADTANQHFNLKLEVLPHPVVNVILPGLQDFNGASVTSSFDKNNNAFKFDADISSLAYGGVKAAGVHAGINTDSKELKYSADFQSLETGPVRLAETSLSGSVADNALLYALRIHGKDTVDKLLITGDFKQDSTKAYRLHFDNRNLVLDNDKWDLANDNYIRFGSKGFVVHDLILSNKDQLLSANTQGDNAETIKIKFNKFQIGTLSQIIEQDTELVRGLIDGSVELRNIHHAPAFVSNLQVSDVVYQQHPVGNINLQADNLSEDKYSAQLMLTGFGNDLQVKGYYSGTKGDNQLNFKVDVAKLNVSSVEPFTRGQLRRSTGYLTGNLTVNGAVTKPVINGDLRFKDVGFNLAYTNSYFTLKDERISIDPKGIYFHSFAILDSLKQKADIDGAIYTSDFKKMNFDLTMTTDNFTVLNTTIKDNSLFFGKMLLNSHIRITGNQLLPVVKVNAKLLRGTHIAVVIPSSKISVDRGEDVVELTDTNTVNNIMNPGDTVLISDRFKGIDLTANLEVTKETSFKVIVDKSSGDSLVVRGDGILSFAMDESGNQSLTGTYNIESGSYRASFQKVIKRELMIQPGGAITWNGSPTDATVNITAVYKVKTSPDDLLSGELANSTPEERNTYKNLLNFNVLMSMKGELLKPDISFKLDMNPEDQGALGGTVYAKVTSLNNDPSELNKQVFALLVMNKFIPANIGNSTGTTNYGDMASNLARNSVNQILTNELNALSGRFIKGVDINVGINANDQYTSSGVTQNTQLSASVKKSFFKERLSVQVGTSINVQNDNGAVKAGTGQNFTGDIILEYKVNKDGSLRFKAFRQNQYDDFIDGSISETGVGVVYNHDFNKFKELKIRRKKKKTAAAATLKKNE